MKKADRQKLNLWQERYAYNRGKWEAQRDRMDDRERLYKGDRKLKRLVAGDRQDLTAPHVHNIIAENIESEVDSNLPQPKVTARRKEDEPLARIIENMLRNEIDRLPMEQLNDMMERTVPIQGGGIWLTEWDSTRKTPLTAGELAVSCIHPKQLVPQDGIFGGLDDMDYFFLVLPQTKSYIKQQYGVDVYNEAETEPSVKGVDDVNSAEDLVDQIVAYYRNDSGGIGLFSWVANTVLQDMDDYQARRLRRCAKCGALEPLGQIEQIEITADDGTNRAVAPLEEAAEPVDGEKPETPTSGRKRRRDECPYCGARSWQESAEDEEEVYLPIHALNVDIDGPEWTHGAEGVELQPVRIPFYKPNVYPCVLQKNVSVYGQLLGDSDVDKIADMQNTMNRLDKKILDRILKAGTRITLPDRADIRMDPRDSEIIYIGNAADKNLIGAYDFKGNLEYELYYRNEVYQQARRILGITDSYQGRDQSATSGKAKEIMAQQSAGRMESKRVLKYAAWARLYEMMFKFKLAYTDEPRPVVSTDAKGGAKYDDFNRYDFLLRREDGTYYWNDQFLFDCDSSSGLATNRQSMWQETTQQLQSGAFGDPTNPQTLELYWAKMEQLHYPGAGDNKAYFAEQAEQMQMQQEMAAAQMQQAPAGAGQLPPEAMDMMQGGGG